MMGHKYFPVLHQLFNHIFWLLYRLNKVKRGYVLRCPQGNSQDLKKNTVEIRCALTQPESILWRIEATETEWSATLVEPSSLTEEMLPEKGEYLDFPDNTELVAPSESPLVQAKQEMRDIIEISFEKDNTHMSEISCIALGELLNNTQQLIYAIAYKDGGLRGPIPKKIREDCTLCVSRWCRQ